MNVYTTQISKSLLKERKSRKISFKKNNYDKIHDEWAKFAAINQIKCQKNKAQKEPKTSETAVFWYNPFRVYTWHNKNFKITLRGFFYAKKIKIKLWRKIKRSLVFLAEGVLCFLF